MEQTQPAGFVELSASTPDSHAKGARVVWTGPAIELHLPAHLGFAQVEPFEWLKDVLERISSYPVNRLEELLPNKWALGPKSGSEKVKTWLAVCLLDVNRES